MKIFKDYQKFNIFDIIFIYLKYLEKNGVGGKIKFPFGKIKLP